MLSGCHTLSESALSVRDIYQITGQYSFNNSGKAQQIIALYHIIGFECPQICTTFLSAYTFIQDHLLTITERILTYNSVNSTFVRMPWIIYFHTQKLTILILVPFTTSSSHFSYSSFAISRSCRLSYALVCQPPSLCFHPRHCLRYHSYCLECLHTTYKYRQWQDQVAFRSVHLPLFQKRFSA